MNFAIRFFITLSVCLFSCIHTAKGQITTDWIAGDGLWGESANWDNGVPVGNFIARIGENAGAIVHDVKFNTISSLEYTGLPSTTNLVLDQPLAVMNLNWDGGTISGFSDIVLDSEGQIHTGTLNTNLVNHGRLTIGIGGSFMILENDFPVVLTNMPTSELVIDNAGLIGTLSGPAGSQITNLPDSKMIINGVVNSFAWNLVNTGTIEVNSNVLFLREFNQIGKGRMLLNNGSVDFFEQGIFEGEISGTGSVLNLDAMLTGIVRPGLSEIGHLEFAGGPKMTLNTQSHFQLGSDGHSDLISNLGGGMQLAGTLNLEATEGALPGQFTLFAYNNAFQFQNQLRLGRLPFGFVGELENDPLAMVVRLNVESMASVYEIDNFKVRVGQIETGNLESLISSDVNQVALRPSRFKRPLRDRRPLVIEVEAQIDIQQPIDTLNMRIESQGSIPLVQTVQWFDFDSGRFEFIRDGAISSTTVVNDITIGSDVGRFIGPDGNVRAQVSFRPNTTQKGWTVDIDQIHFATE